jgi:2-polyprenyl-3-methyl-5-hydroxy-6-metoxy-1,4-benzoquinol methylase
MIELKKLMNDYRNKLKLLDSNGLALAARIISTISLHRDMDHYIFTDEEPSNYLGNIFEKQFSFFEYINHIINLLNLNELESSNVEYDDDQNARDNLHIKLFNSTWKTLTLNDPSNDYKKWINVIKGRLELNNLNEQFFKGKKCIDIGCGSGRFSFCMANFGANVWGIDPGEESISFAKMLAKKMNINNTNFLVQNAYSLDFEDNFFDFASCNGVLHHLDKPIKALEEIFRVLDKKGKFWLYVEGNGGIYHDIWDMIHNSFNGIPYQKTLAMIEKLDIPDIHFWMDRFYAKYNFISFDENEKRLRDIGFKNIKRMKSSEQYDLNIDMFTHDKNAKLKFGDGGIRILATK